MSLNKFSCTTGRCVTNFEPCNRAGLCILHKYKLITLILKNENDPTEDINQSEEIFLQIIHNDMNEMILFLWNVCQTKEEKDFVGHCIRTPFALIASYHSLCQSYLLSKDIETKNLAIQAIISYVLMKHVLNTIRTNTVNPRIVIENLRRTTGEGFDISMTTVIDAFV